ncbi:ABC transporter permease [Streptomyces sp. NPDC047860]|uniref:ABC transporter permease n=1 Tax=Streptomyces sp. NPDC047860 TaxID=3155743 RepID=UPI0033FBA1BB
MAGIYRDSADQDPEYLTPAGNGVIAPIGATATNLDGAHNKSATVSHATFTLHDPDELEAFEKQAEDKAGAELDGFVFRINDKAVRQMTGPLTAVASSATAAMWLTGVAGAGVSALLTTLAVKQRRREFGVLLSMGEQRWKLVAQQVTEILVVAALAVGLSSLFAEQLTQKAAGSMVSSEADTARKQLDAWEPPPPGSTGLNEGIERDDRPVEGADPIDEITVRLGDAAPATVAGVGLGIGLPATALPRRVRPAADPAHHPLEGQMTMTSTMPTAPPVLQMIGLSHSYAGQARRTTVLRQPSPAVPGHGTSCCGP